MGQNATKREVEQEFEHFRTQLKAVSPKWLAANSGVDVKTIYKIRVEELKSPDWRDVERLRRTIAKLAA